MSTISKVREGLDQVKAMLSDGEYKIEVKSAKELSKMLQRRFDALPPDDKKTIRNRVESSLASLKNALKKPNKPNLKNRAKGGSISKLKAGGFPDMSGDGKVTKKDILIGRGVINRKSGGLAGRLAQRGYGKARS